MKLLSSYKKEMKIAFRGFYFYIEVFMAILMLLILLVAIDENPNSSEKEYLYYDAPAELIDVFFFNEDNVGENVEKEPTELKIKSSAFEVLNRDTSERQSYVFEDEKVIMARTIQGIDIDTGRIEHTYYILDSKENALRLANATGSIGAAILMNDQGEIRYEYMTQGYETERFSNLLYVFHTLSMNVVDEEFNQQTVRTIGSTERLNTREMVVPIFVVFAGSLMGMFIVISYLFLDKDQGVIRAFAVTPSSVWEYLISKTMVIITTVVISSSIITIPVMGLKPNYLWFYIFLVITTFAFSALGLLIASFYDSISKAFGVIYLLMIVMMLPAFSYFISSFDPIWVRFFPTYPLLQIFKDIVMGQAEFMVMLTYSLIYLIGGVFLMFLANAKFKKTLTL